MAVASVMSLMPKPGDAVCYYGRVSTKKQKLEHQREFVRRWLDQEGINVPPDCMFEDKEKRHKSAEREKFQQLLDLARSGRIEWIVIASFERWGIADVDEFFDFRRQLKSAGVRLWSVQDQLDLTGCNDADYYRIITLAVAHTMAMATYAEQNIRKMISMALGGWHASKEHPYGTDLLCCHLDDQSELFRVQLVSKDLERRGPRIYKIVHADGRTETANKMPPRDCKATGYRLVPSLDRQRIENVKLVFEMFDQGLTNREIADRLWSMGRNYFGKLFGPHAIESILKNPAYVGRPAWGKAAIGQYRQVFDKVARKPAPRKKNEPRTFDKGEENYIFPTEPVFDPETFISLSLWNRVQSKLKGKPKRDYETRRRSKTIHPLNGLLACPDCGRRMVVNNTTGRHGERIPYFICGGYAKSGKTICRPNSIRFSKVDEAMRICWENVSTSLGELASLKKSGENLTLEKLVKSNLRAFAEVFATIIYDEIGSSAQVPKAGQPVPDKTQIEWLKALAAYRKRWNATRAKAGDRLNQVEREINQIGDLLKKTPSQTLQKRWFAELENLEQEKAQIEARSVSLIDKLKALADHSEALAKTLAESKAMRESSVWETFVEKVVPIMEDLPSGKGTQRTATSFRFEPKLSVQDMLGGALEINLIRRGRDSAPRSA